VAQAWWSSIGGVFTPEVRAQPEALAAMRAAVAETFPEIVLESVADFMVLPSFER